MSALSAVAALAGLLVATMGPGTAVLAAAGLRGLPLAALAPAVSSAVLVIGALVAGLTGLAWAWPVALAATAVAVAVAVGVRRLLGPPEILQVPRRDRAAGLVAWGVAAVAALLAAVPLRAGMGGLRGVAQTPDGERHVGALRLIRANGHGSPLTILHPPHPLFPSVGNATRPGAWHDLVSTAMSLTGTDAVVAANVSALVLAGVVVPLGAGYAASALLPGWRWAAPLGMLAGTAFASLPALVVSYGTLWPFAWATGLLPAVLAALVLLLRGWGLPARARWAGLVVWVVAVVGTAAADRDAVFSLGVLALPLLLAAALTRWQTLWRAGSGARALAEAGACAVMAVGLIVADLVVTAGRLPAAPKTMSLAQGVGEAILDTPYSEQPFGVGAPAWLLGAAVLGGVWLALRSPGLRAWTASWVVAVFVYALAGGTPADGPWRRAVTSWWYDDPIRLGTLQAVVAAPLVVVAISGLTRWLTERLRHGPSPRVPLSPPRLALVLGVLGLVAVTLLSVQRAGVREDRVRFDYAPRAVTAAQP